MRVPLMCDETCDSCIDLGIEDECSGKTDPAPCPYGEEISGDMTPCNCCEVQQAKCRSDI
jgi:hypothetical protein